MSEETLTRDDVIAWLRAFSELVSAQRDYLTALDAEIGDADHGANLDRGMQAVMARLPAVAGQPPGGIFKAVGMTLVSTVGGASGPLFGTFFLQLGTGAGNGERLALSDWLPALQAAVEGVQARGKAAPGDKTMVDALAPALGAVIASEAHGEGLAAALRRGAAAAEQGAAATIPLVARKGRASYLGERSAGHQDPGATSAALLLRTLAETQGTAS
jgi:dihydroxyacetone kinase-like protein